MINPLALTKELKKENIRKIATGQGDDYVTVIH